MGKRKSFQVFLELRDDVNLCEDLIKITAVLRATLLDLQIQCETLPKTPDNEKYIAGAGDAILQVIANACLNLEPPQQYDFLECCGISDHMIDGMLMEIRQKEKNIRE